MFDKKILVIISKYLDGKDQDFFINLYNPSPPGLPGLFSTKIKKYNFWFAKKFINYNLCDFETDLKIIKECIDEMYKSDEEDIKDFYDLIKLISDNTLEVIENQNFSPEQTQRMLKLRVYAKKQVKQKYRDYKYKGRNFWNSDEADNQYFEGVEYLWKLSVVEITEAIQNFRE